MIKTTIFTINKMRHAKLVNFQDFSKLLTIKHRILIMNSNQSYNLIK